jgi:hypothetical protein
MILAAAFLIAMLGPGLRTGVPSARQLAAGGLITVLTLVCGRAVTSWMLPTRSTTLGSVGAVVAGVAVLSVVHLTATVVVPLDVYGALAVDGFVAAALLWGTRSSSNRPPDPDEPNARLADGVVLVAIAAVVTLWSREAILALDTATSGGVFPAWQDFFLHAAEIVYVRDYPIFNGTSLYLAGSPQPLYHRASYALPALYSALGSSPALETAMAFWLPLGMTLCGFASYGLGTAIGGRTAGVAAAAAVLLIPDASTYGTRNTFFSFHWLTEIAPGSGYAIAILLLAFALFISGDAERNRARCLWSIPLAVAALGFRAHVAALGLATLLTLNLLLYWNAIRQKRLLLVVGAAVALAGVGGILLLERMALAPHFVTSRSNPTAFFNLVHVQVQAPGEGALYTKLTAGHGTAWTIAVGYALMVVSYLGLLTAFVVLPPMLAGARRLDWRVGVIPLALIAVHFVIILVIPAPSYGQVDDIGHRSFVLPYAVTAALAGALVITQLAKRVGGRSLALLRMAGMVAIGAATALVPFQEGRAIQQRWAGQLATIPLSADTIVSARYVRQRAAKGDIILSSNEDPLAILVALSERAAYVSRRDLYGVLGGDSGQLAALRTRQNAELAGATSMAQLHEFGRRHQVQWYFLSAGDMPDWPPDLTRQCESCGTTFRVFNLRNGAFGTP